MRLVRVGRQCFCAILSMVIPVSLLHSQTAPPTTASANSSTQAHNLAKQASNSQAAVPVTMTECEGVNDCATWTFLGAQGNGQWPSGEVANLTVETLDGDKLEIRRADSTGASAGLTATYTGTRQGDRVGGEFVSSWPGHWENKAGNWYATVGKNPLNPPSVMRVCDTVRCGTWTWKDGHYDGVWSDIGVTATMTVVSFTPDSVIIKRTDDASGANKSYIYKGKISSEGESIVNGESSGIDNNFFGYFTATWGSALKDTRARAASAPIQQQPVLVVQPAVCIPWFFTVICN
jgi:hypothetical protein